MNEVTYQIIENQTGDDYLNRIDADGKVWFVPMDINNADYQAYLLSLETPQEKPKSK